MKCEAVAVRTGKRCKNEAIGESGACEIEAHKAQVIERRQSDEAIAPTWDSLDRQLELEETNRQPRPDPAANDRKPIGDDPSPAPASSSEAPRALNPELAALLAGLPTVEDRTAADIAATTAGAPIVRDLGELQRQARKVLPDVGELLEDDELDPADVDAAAAARAEDQDAARVQLRRDVTAFAGQWKPERVKFYLRVLINPRFVKDGKDPLTDDELEEGAELGAQMLNDWFGTRPENPTAAVLAWGATVVITRYVEEVFGWVGGIARRVRGRPAAPRPSLDDVPPPASPAAPASAQPGRPSLVDSGFGVLN